MLFLVTSYVISYFFISFTFPYKERTSESVLRLEKHAEENLQILSSAHVQSMI